MTPNHKDNSPAVGAAQERTTKDKLNLIKEVEQRNDERIQAHEEAKKRDEQE